jgi:hypothetical protein
MDTSLEAEALRFESWRAMSSTEKGELVARASRALLELPFQGLRDRLPEAPEQELRAGVLEARCGSALAQRVLAGLRADSDRWVHPEFTAR